MNTDSPIDGEGSETSSGEPDTAGAVHGSADAAPTVSVVIPTYDRPEMLVKAIRSVLDQTLSDVEIVVVDDGSPEAPTQVIDEFDDRIVFHRFEENRGANVARSEGIKRSRGSYVAFLDDDDRWDEEKLERQVAALEANDAAGVCYTGQRLVSSDGETRRNTPSIAGDASKALLTDRYLITFSSLVVDRETIRKAGVPDPELPNLQDREWLLRLARHAEFVSIEEPLLSRRVGGHGQITDRYERLRDFAYPYIYRKHRGFATEFGWRYRFGFKASLLGWIGSLALYSGRYNEARRYLLASFVYWPFSTHVLVRLLVSLGGEKCHSIIKLLRDRYQTSRIPKLIRDWGHAERLSN